MRQFRWRLEAGLVRLLLGFSHALGPIRASNLGGAVARTIGPWLPVSRIGLRNLELAFPGRDAAWRAATLRDSWENLGRTVMELPHVGQLPQNSGEGPGWEVVGAGNLPRGGRAILVSAHLANWEVLPRAGALAGLRMGGFYRAPDNPYVAELLRGLRGTEQELALFPKGSAGARQALKHLSGGGALGLLADQKLNEGLELPFFGQPAMTTSAPAELALRFQCPLIPVQVTRLGPCRFRILVEPPLVPPGSGDRHADIRALTLAVNQRIEAWLRERPGEWLWLHRRLPKSAYRGSTTGRS
ncbi:LpxL/LpxP family acyltransferase [Roseomonas marmotae]|uniref:Lauroyl acyltransferase n=1 Tax=Roseomonas marmotae TaxID=2768161 RepID=A0ABS3K9C8_9PROT|nr:lauroyl acyltransferase [Roseomonas marmotae]MBO1073622.1 lauroyl acyltransferase [Roseomonas marmotae]MBO1073652.1 lauroyl acyltransferase [Roseomonas marmotae]QTI80198.1 lauroyl acyltransferase [Roseomonas marmotae]